MQKEKKREEMCVKKLNVYNILICYTVLSI